MRLRIQLWRLARQTLPRSPAKAVMTTRKITTTTRTETDVVAAEAGGEVVAEVGMVAGLINRIERNGLTMTKEEPLTSTFEVFVSLQVYKIDKT